METGLVPVSVLVGQVLAVAADGFPALLAGAGVEGLEARHAVGALLPQDVLLAKERAFAMVAIKALGHFDTGFSTTRPVFCPPARPEGTATAQDSCLAGFPEPTVCAAAGQLSCSCQQGYK